MGKDGRCAQEHIYPSISTIQAYIYESEPAISLMSEYLRDDDGGWAVWEFSPHNPVSSLMLMTNTVMSNLMNMEKWRMEKRS